MSSRAEALRKVQQLNFAMIELGLYLNNQPDCKDAMIVYEKLKRMHAEAKRHYEECYGPLCYEGINTEKDRWSWINDPWPWKGEDA